MVNRIEGLVRSSEMKLFAGLTAGLLLIGLAGCALDASPAAPESPPYTGPLYLAPDELKTTTDREAGAAGRVVSCATPITGDRDDPDRLHEGAPAATPEKALRVADGEGRLFTERSVYQLERTDADRALFTHRVDGVIRQALIMHHGPTMDRGGKVGWYLETRARCDWAELPDDVSAWMGGERQIWEDADGRRVSTDKIISVPGPEHCDWQSMTLLTLAGMPDLTFYVRKPTPDLEDYFAEPYRADVAVPGDAVDTGYSRNGHRLWLAADKQRAYVGTAEHAELWPITTQPLGCA